MGKYWCKPHQDDEPSFNIVHLQEDYEEILYTARRKLNKGLPEQEPKSYPGSPGTYGSYAYTFTDIPPKN